MLQSRKHSRSHPWAPLLVTFAGLIFVSNSAKAAMVFTDRAAWEAALTDNVGHVLDTFNDITSRYVIAPNGLDRGEYQLSVNDETGGGALIAPSPLYSSYAGGIDNTTFLAAYLFRAYINYDIPGIPDVILQDELTFTFDQPIAGFGVFIRILNQRDAGGNSFRTNAGESGHWQGPAVGSVEFRGVVLERPATTFTLVGTGFTMFDNVETYYAHVPEPTALYLWSCGLAAISLLMCSRHRMNRACCARCGDLQG